MDRLMLRWTAYLDKQRDAFRKLDIRSPPSPEHQEAREDLDMLSTVDAVLRSAQWMIVALGIDKVIERGIHVR